MVDLTYLHTYVMNKFVDKVRDWISEGAVLCTHFPYIVVCTFAIIFVTLVNALTISCMYYIVLSS